MEKQQFYKMVPIYEAFSSIGPCGPLRWEAGELGDSSKRRGRQVVLPN